MLALRSLWNPRVLLRNPKTLAVSQSMFSRALSTTTTGTVKFYMRDKGYGFVNPDGRDDVDLFVHRQNIDCSIKIPEQILAKSIRYPYLKKGERVRFVVANNNGLETATNVTWLDGKKIPPERSNFLGGVHERVKRVLGEKVYDIMAQEGLNNEVRSEKILEAFVESKRNIQNAEQYLEKLGMNPSDFPTVRVRATGRYVFKQDAAAAGEGGTGTGDATGTKKKRRRRRNRGKKKDAADTATQPPSQVPPEGLAAFEAAIASDDSNEDEFRFDDLTSDTKPSEAATMEEFHYETFASNAEGEQGKSDDEKSSVSFTSTTVETMTFDFSTSEQGSIDQEKKEEVKVANDKPSEEGEKVAESEKVTLDFSSTNEKEGPKENK